MKSSVIFFIICGSTAYLAAELRSYTFSLSREINLPFAYYGLPIYIFTISLPMIALYFWRKNEILIIMSYCYLHSVFTFVVSFSPLDIESIIFALIVPISLLWLLFPSPGIFEGVLAYFIGIFIISIPKMKNIKMSQEYYSVKRALLKWFK